MPLGEEDGTMDVSKDEEPDGGTGEESIDEIAMI